MFPNFTGFVLLSFGVDTLSISLELSTMIAYTVYKLSSSLLIMLVAVDNKLFT